MAVGAVTPAVVFNFTSIVMSAGTMLSALAVVVEMLVNVISPSAVNVSSAVRFSVKSTPSCAVMPPM